MDEAEYCHRLALMNRGRIIALGTPEQLKREHQQSVLMNLISSDPLESMKSLEDAPSILDIAVFGAGLHVTVQNSTSAEGVIRRALAERKVEIRLLEVIPPSMEDIFVALIGEEEQKTS